MLAFTGIDMKPVVEAGTFEVMVGSSSNEGLKKQFKLSNQDRVSLDKEAIEKSMVRALEWQEQHPIFFLGTYGLDKWSLLCRRNPST